MVQINLEVDCSWYRSRWIRNCEEDTNFSTMEILAAVDADVWSLCALL